MSSVYLGDYLINHILSFLLQPTKSAILIRDKLNEICKFRGVSVEDHYYKAYLFTRCYNFPCVFVLSPYIGRGSDLVWMDVGVEYTKAQNIKMAKYVFNHLPLRKCVMTQDRFIRGITEGQCCWSNLEPKRISELYLEIKWFYRRVLSYHALADLERIIETCEYLSLRKTGKEYKQLKTMIRGCNDILLYSNSKGDNALYFKIHIK